MQCNPTLPSGPLPSLSSLTAGLLLKVTQFYPVQRSFLALGVWAERLYWVGTSNAMLETRMIMGWTIRKFEIKLAYNRKPSSASHSASTCKQGYYTR